MSDDQDARLGSLDAQPYVRDVLMKEGISLSNHHATVAQCCPSRTSYLRGQSAHNTNLTHVVAPGYVVIRPMQNSSLANVGHDSGGYEKFVQSGQDLNYLPHWLKAAGYRSECKSDSRLNHIQRQDVVLMISRHWKVYEWPQHGDL